MCYSPCRLDEHHLTNSFVRERRQETTVLKRILRRRSGRLRRPQRTPAPSVSKLVDAVAFRHTRTPRKLIFAAKLTLGVILGEKRVIKPTILARRFSDIAYIAVTKSRKTDGTQAGYYTWCAHFGQPAGSVRSRWQPNPLDDYRRAQSIPTRPEHRLVLAVGQASAVRGHVRGGLGHDAGSSSAGAAFWPLPMRTFAASFLFRNGWRSIPHPLPVHTCRCCKRG